MTLTNFNDEFFDNLPSKLDSEVDNEEGSGMSGEKAFIAELGEAPFLLKAVSGEISLDAIAQQLGYKHRSGALRFLRRGYAKLRRQFEAEHGPN